jgi:hypothetical protein
MAAGAWHRAGRERGDHTPDTAPAGCAGVVHRAIARLGATYEGTLRRYQRRADGSVRDTALFSITAEQWPEVRNRLKARLC